MFRFFPFRVFSVVRCPGKKSFQPRKARNTRKESLAITRSSFPFWVLVLMREKSLYAYLPWPMGLADASRLRVGDPTYHSLIELTFQQGFTGSSAAYGFTFVSSIGKHSIPLAQNREVDIIHSYSAPLPKTESSSLLSTHP